MRRAPSPVRSPRADARDRTRGARRRGRPSPTPPPRVRRHRAWRSGPRVPDDIRRFAKSCATPAAIRPNATMRRSASARRDESSSDRRASMWAACSMVRATMSATDSANATSTSVHRRGAPVCSWHTTPTTSPCWKSGASSIEHDAVGLEVLGGQLARPGIGAGVVRDDPAVLLQRHAISRHARDGQLDARLVGVGGATIHADATQHGAVVPEQPDAHPLDVQGAGDQPRGSREHPLEGLRLVHRQAGEAEPASLEGARRVLDHAGTVPRRHAPRERFRRSPA